MVSADVGFPGRSQVAAGDDAGGAVVGGEVVESPQRGDHDVAVARQRVDALVVVEDLRLLAGMDLDSAGDSELRARSNHLLHRVEDDGRQRGLIQMAGHRERSPGPLRPRPVEAGPPLGRLQQRAKFRPSRGHGIQAKQPRNDRVPIPLQLPRYFIRVRHIGIVGRPGPEPQGGQTSPAKRPAGYRGGFRGVGDTVPT